jgi:hypothetical protein
MPSIKDNYQFSIFPKSEGVMNGEVQFVMSQIELSSEREP